MAITGNDIVRHKLDGSEEDPRSLNRAGLEALSAGNLIEARRLLETAIERDSEADALWLNLATCCRQMGDDQGEETALARVLAINRGSLAGWIRQAERQQRLFRNEDASKSWRNAFELQTAFGPPNEATRASLAGGKAFLAEQATRLGTAISAALGDESAGEDNRPATWRLRAGIDAMLGSRRIYTNDCAGFHFPFLPAEEFFARRHFPWLEELEASTAAIREEFSALMAEDEMGQFRPYVQMEPGNPANKWSPLDGSLDWNAGFLWEYGQPNEINLSRCAHTRNILESLPLARIAGRGPSAFFSVLAPGAHIPPHTGVTNVRSIVHLPLIVPEGCWFRVGGEKREWVEGQAFVFDDTIEHEAVNPTAEFRAVLIFDVWNPWLSRAEIEGLQAMFAAIELGD